LKIVLLLLLITSQYLFALISITPVEIGDKAGIHGKVFTSLQTKRGNTDKDNYKAGLKVTYDSNNSFVSWAEVSAEYGESNDIEDTNKAYIHLRHIHALTKKNLRTELFSQVEEDKFRLIQRRILGGAGVRVKMFDTLENTNAYLGFGALYETIKYTSTVDKKEDNIRFNGYFAYTMNLTKDSKLSYSLYYQPKYNKFKDYIQAHKMDLKLQVYKSLFLKLRVAYDVDSIPAIGVKKYDFYQETSFVLNF